jgi:hypothetical protein
VKIAVMQPYFFPYLGYWQLAKAVDRFVIFDDVQYIVRGWINRNRILVNGAPRHITVPIAAASRQTQIRDVRLSADRPWREKLSTTIRQSYARAPFFDEVFPTVDSLLRCQAERLCDYLRFQIESLSSLVGITAGFELASSHPGAPGLRGQARILELCRKFNARTYVNPAGGRTLYDAREFAHAGVELRFISPAQQSYGQRVTPFVPDLSIIDPLMELGISEVRRRLDQFELAAA